MIFLDNEIKAIYSVINDDSRHRGKQKHKMNKPFVEWAGLTSILPGKRELVRICFLLIDSAHSTDGFSFGRNKL